MPSRAARSSVINPCLFQENGQPFEDLQQPTPACKGASKERMANLFWKTRDIEATGWQHPGLPTNSSAHAI